MSEISDQTTFEKLGDVYRTAREEHSEATLGQRALLVATLGSLAFEWSTGNEAMLGFVGSRVHELTHNPIVTGIATGSASFAEQGAIGALMAATIHNFPEVANKVRETVTRGEDASDETKAKRFASVMLLGSGVELAKENAVRHHERPENVRRAIGSAAIIASANTVLIGSMSGLLKLGEDHGFESTAENIVSVTSNPLTYLAIIGSVIGYNRAKKAFHSGKFRKSKRVAGEVANEVSGE